MDKRNSTVSVYDYIWVIVKSLFMVCLLVFVISILVMYFSMPEKVALFLTIFSMFVGIIFCGYESAILSQNRQKLLAFLCSSCIAVLIFVLSIIFKGRFEVSKYHLYVLLFGPVVGFIGGVLSSGKTQKRTRGRRR